mgnify:CR=1 FL=1|jgi:hypothetical protein
MNGKKIALSLILALLLVASLCACAPADNSQKSVVIIIGEREFALNTQAAFLHDALLELKETGEIEVYSFSGSGTGIYIDELSGLDASAQNSFIGVYHNIDDATLIDYQYGGSQTVGGETFRSSNVGVAALPLVDGAKYLLTVSTF